MCIRDSPLDAEQGAIGVVAHIRRFGVGAECIALHDPEIGAPIAQQDTSVIDQSAIDSGHRQRDADQQTEPEAGEHKLAPAVEDVATGEIDHRLAPTRVATTLTFASGCNACSLCTTTSSPIARPARIWLRPSRVVMPTSTGWNVTRPVSYTHLDVYKRQAAHCTRFVGVAGKTHCNGAACHGA